MPVKELAGQALSELVEFSSVVQEDQGREIVPKARVL